MAKTKKKRRSFRSRFGHWRRHRDKRIPIIATAGAVGSFFIPRDKAYRSAGQWVMNTIQGQPGNLMENNGMFNFFGDLLTQYTGYDFRNGSWGFPVATGMIVGTSIASKLVNKFAPKTLEKLPYIGNRVKW